MSEKVPPASTDPPQAPAAGDLPAVKADPPPAPTVVPSPVPTAIPQPTEPPKTVPPPAPTVVPPMAVPPPAPTVVPPPAPTVVPPMAVPTVVPPMTVPQVTVPPPMAVPQMTVPPSVPVESEDEEETTDIYGVPDSVLVNRNIELARKIAGVKIAATTTLCGTVPPTSPATTPPDGLPIEGIPPPVAEMAESIPLLQRFFRPIKWVVYNKIRVGAYALAAITLVLLVTPPSYTPANTIKETIEIIHETYCDRSEVGKLIQGSINEYATSSLGYGGLQKPTKLPAIDQRLLFGLSNYVCENFPLNKVFSLWGPLGCGKTLTVNHMARIWRKQGRVVIYVDMSDFSGHRGAGELRKLISDAIQEGFRNVDLTARSLRALDELLEDKSPARKVATGMVSSAINMLLKLALQGFTLLPLEGLEQKLHNMYDKRLQSLGRFMESFIQDDDEALVGIRFGNFFDALHLLSLTQPKTAPIVIFSNLNSVELASIEVGNVFLDDLVDLLEDHEDDKNAVPVIITSDDTLWQHQADAAHSSLFLQFEVREMAEQDVMDLLVDKIQVWTQSEFSLVWKTMGGWFGLLDKTYRLQTMFQLRIEDAIQRVESEAYGALLGAITSWNDTDIDDATTPQSLLQTLHNAQYALPLSSLDDMLSAEEIFLKKDILYMDSELKLRPVHKLMETTIREYLSTPQQESGSQGRPLDEESSSEEDD